MQIRVLLFVYKRHAVAFLNIQVSEICQMALSVQLYRSNCLPKRKSAVDDYHKVFLNQVGQSCVRHVLSVNHWSTPLEIEKGSLEYRNCKPC